VLFAANLVIVTPLTVPITAYVASFPCTALPIKTTPRPDLVLSENPVTSS